MKNTLLLLLLLIFISIGCQSDTAPKEASTTSIPQEEALDWPLIQKKYKAGMAERINPLPLHQIPEKGKLNPVDEAPKDTAFFVFRTQLIEAVQKKDLLTFLELCAADIRVTVDDTEGGAAALIEHWDLDTPTKVSSSLIWKYLEDVLSLGGVFGPGGKHFYAPYLYTTFPDQYDEKFGAVTGSGVRLRSAATLSSKVVKKLSYNIVEIISVLTDQKETISGETHPWVHIKLLDGQTEGYLYGKYLRSATDYRLGFERKGNRWTIVFFVAGD